MRQSKKHLNKSSSNSIDAKSSRNVNSSINLKKNDMTNN